MTDVSYSREVSPIYLDTPIGNPDFTILEGLNLTDQISRRRAEIADAWENFYQREKNVSNPLESVNDFLRDQILDSIAEALVESSAVLGIKPGQEPMVEFYKDTRNYDQNQEGRPKKGAVQRVLETKSGRIGRLLVNMVNSVWQTKIAQFDPRRVDENLSAFVSHEVAHEVAKTFCLSLSQKNIEANEKLLRGDEEDYWSDPEENAVENFAQSYVEYKGARSLRSQINNLQFTENKHTEFG